MEPDSFTLLILINPELQSHILHSAPIQHSAKIPQPVNTSFVSPHARESAFQNPENSCLQIQNPRVWNPTNDWNLESKFH